MVDEDEVFCTSCRAVIPRETPYCPECGAEQNHVTKGESEDEQGEHLPPNKEYCSNCREVIPSDTPYCPECGNNQADVDTVEDTESDSEKGSWMIGFTSSTIGNICIGLVYFFLWPVGLSVLLYSYCTRKRGWSRRKTGVTFAMVILVLFIGLAILGAVAPQPDSPQDSTASQNDVGGNTAPQESNSGQSQSLDVAVRVQYSGDWSGALSVRYDQESNTRSISGSGTQTISIDGDPEYVGLNAQKRDGGSGTLRVQIIEDGEVISESSTSSQYGIAQTSADIDDFV